MMFSASFPILAAALSFVPSTELASEPTWCDFDCDRLADLYVVAPGSDDRLLRNQGDGDFEDVTAPAGLAGSRSRSVAWQDYDGDGWPDLLQVGADGGARLFVNSSSGWLAEVTVDSGLGSISGATDAQWFDYDCDGHPDLRLRADGQLVLLHNRGDGCFARVDLDLPAARLVEPLRESVVATNPGDVERGLDANQVPTSRGERARRAAVGGASTDSAESQNLITGPGGVGVSPGPPSAASMSFTCAETIEDQAGGPCLEASSIPALGSLYPMSPELNVDPSGRVGIGTITPNARVEIDALGSDTGLFAQRASGAAPVIHVVSDALDNFSSALKSEINASSGISYSLWARNLSANGHGLFADARHPSGPAIGVIGRSLSANGSGVRGFAAAASGVTYGIHGEASSPAGWAGYFDGRGYFRDFVGIGVDPPLYPLHVQGDVRANFFRVSDSSVIYSPGADILRLQSQQDVYIASGDDIWLQSNRVLAGALEVTGFELTTNPQSGYVLTSDANGIGTWQPAPGGGGGIGGSGTAGRLPRFTGSTTLADSALFQNGSGWLGVGTTSIDHGLHVTAGPVNIGDGSTHNLRLEGRNATKTGAKLSFGGSTNPIAYIWDKAPGVLEVLGSAGLSLTGQDLDIAVFNGVTLDSASSFDTALRVESTAGGGIGTPALYVVNNSAGAGIAIDARTKGNDVTALFTNTGTGPILRGFRGGSTPVFEVKNSGRVVTTALEITGGGDLVEAFDVTGACPPGTVVVIDPERPGALRASIQPYDRKVAGVVSGAGGVNHGILLTQEDVLEGDTLVAMTGRVWVRASAENGPIEPGDRLTTAALTGHAMRATDSERTDGAVIGKAMTPLAEGAGLVLCLVNLQ